METPAADVTIPNEALAELGEGKTVTGTGIKAALDLKFGEVAVMVNPDGTETIIPKSAVEDSKTYVVLESGATVKVIDNSRNFEDVHNEWYASSVNFVSSHELFLGVSDTEFAPETNMSRAMLATVLWRLESEKDAEKAADFKDVAAGQFYTEGVAWASENEIITGTAPSTFEPDKDVTRQEMVTMIYRYAKSLGLDVTVKTDLTAFKDADRVDSWAKDAMTWAVSTGIIQGTDTDTLDPAGTATRAQVATVMERLVEVIVK